jgi:hypothetical protein
MTTPTKQEPAAIWSSRLIVFDKEISLAQNIILSHGRSALSALLKKIKLLYELLDYMPNMIGFYPHPDIPLVLTEMCFHQGMASSIMFNNSERGHNENARSYRARIERYGYVHSFCKSQGVNIPILTSRTVRNQMVHIDAYLEKALRKPNAGWLIDGAIAYRDQFSAPDGISIEFCRAFIASKEIILHLGDEIPIRGLWHEATAVLAVVFGTPPTEPPPSPSHSRLAPLPPPPQTEA